MGASIVTFLNRNNKLFSVSALVNAEKGSDL